jgi:hypothetical protein
MDRVIATGSKAPMESKRSAFALAHPQDRTFFALNAVVAWAAVVMGFSPDVLGHFSGTTPFPPPIVHVHAIVFAAWLALFTVQIWMIRSRRIHIHRRLGLLGAWMVPVVVIVGTVTNIVTQRIHLEAGAFEPGFFILAFVDMLRFACLAGAGLLLRRHVAAHKRLLLLATICLLDAGYGRWTNDWFFARFGDNPVGFFGQLFFFVNCTIVIAMLYDLGTRKTVHLAYLVAVPFIVLTQVATSWIAYSKAWSSMARGLLG